MIGIRILGVLTAALASGAALPAAYAGTPMIVGGSTAAAGAWPSIALLEGRYSDDGNQSVFRCTGSVVAPSWIVTAAHCAFGRGSQPPDSMRVVLGVTDYQDPAAEVQTVDRFVPNPDYDSNDEFGDIALVHLAQPTSRPPIALAASGAQYVSPPGVPNAAGWGALDEAGTEFSTQLQQAYLQIHSAAECAAIPGFDPATQTCAGTAGTAGVCFGDSGGPLVQFDPGGGAPVLWGVTSYRPESGDGLPCPVSKPAVFSLVPAFSDFLQRTMAGADIGPAADSAPAEPAAQPASEPAAVRSCRRAKAHLTAARRSERQLRRRLSAVKRLQATPAARKRVHRARSRYRRAHARRLRAVARADRVCAAA